MDEDTDDTDTEPTTGEGQPNAPAASAAPAAPASITVPQSSMAQIKARARAQGRREATAAMESKMAGFAKFLGFKSLEEMESTDPEEWRKRQASAVAKPAAAPSTARVKSRGSSALERENARLLEEKKRLNRLRSVEERKRRSLERELAAKDAESELRVAAIRAGVQDVDYALHLLRREMSSKSPEEISKFDEGVFFGTELRRNHPYLYATEVVPANTGAPTDGNKAPPPPAPPTTESAGADAKKLSREEYVAVLKRKGLTDPSVGMPS